MTDKKHDDTPEDLLAAVLDQAKSLGADAADALMYESTSHGVSVRLNEIEDVERSESRDLGVRVIIGQKQASVSTTDYTDTASLKEIVARCVAMAKAAPEDRYCGLAPKDRLARAPFDDLELCDGAEPETDALAARARDCEAAALAVGGISNSSGAEAGYGSGTSWFATSDGFFGSATGGSHSVSVSVLAGEGTQMERDYDYDRATYLADLRAADEVGRAAGLRTVRRLEPRKLDSQSAPVIFEQRLAGSILSHLAGAINGASIARGVSFLKDRMETGLFAPGIQITDDPTLKRGFGSRPFDGEGVRTTPRDIIDKGTLTSWILNSSQARQLGLETTGHAQRGTGGPPGSGTTNFFMHPGEKTFDEMIASTPHGLYVTDKFGPQINSNTGDYSVGCSGFMIEGGEIAYPVSEVTIAGNLLDMFRSLEAANDLVFSGRVNAPTLCLGEMTIAGN